MKDAHKRRELRSFLKHHRGQRVMLGTVGGFVMSGILVGYTRRAITLQDAQIMQANGDPINLHIMSERLCSVILWGVPEDNPFRQIVLTGQIMNSDTSTPANGALIKVLLQRGNGPSQTLGYTYSGCDGWYMFPLKRAMILPNDRILLQIVGPVDGRESHCCSTL